MEQTADAILTALRVLNALVVKRDPEPADIDQLRILSPSLPETPLDELANDVIHQVLRRVTSATQQQLMVRWRVWESVSSI